MNVSASSLYNLTRLARFAGRQSRAQFWPYGLLVIALEMVAISAVMAPVLADSVARTQRFAIEHPELATIQSGAATYSIHIEGYHPELFPDMASAMARMSLASAVAVALLAAAAVRRLHDTGKSGLRAALPVPFLIFAAIMFPKLFAGSEFNVGLFMAVFVNNILYVASIVFLVVSLTRAAIAGDNRYGSAPLA